MISLLTLVLKEKAVSYKVHVCGVHWYNLVQVLKSVLKELFDAVLFRLFE